MDLALRLLRSGYEGLAAERARHGGADPYVGRLLGRRAVVVRGRSGAELFYDETVVRRRGAVPPPLGWLLFGRGAVHALDDGDHRQRKQLFLEVLEPGRTTELAAVAEQRLAARVARWAADPPQAPGDLSALFDVLVETYAESVLPWAGIDAAPGEQRRVGHELAGIVDGFGFSPRAYARGWLARWRSERWAADLVRQVRDGRRTARAGSALHVLARGRGRDLAARTAGVELLNVVRPTVAVAWPATLAAAAVLARPEAAVLRTAGATGTQADRADRAAGRAVVHEARRTTPFVPALAGRVRRPTRLGDVALHRGDHLVLDVLGTNLDPRWWHDRGGADGAFDARRFADGDPDPYAFVPQGGGDPRTGHRCPGEPLTVLLVEGSLRVLADAGVAPDGPVALDLHRMPTRPRGALRRPGCPVPHPEARP